MVSKIPTTACMPSEGARTVPSSGHARTRADLARNHRRSTTYKRLRVAARQTASTGVARSDGTGRARGDVVRPRTQGGSTLMNSETLKGQWKQLKGQVRKQWGKLTDDDLDQIHGDAEILAGKIQERYGRAKDEAQREVDDFFDQQQSPRA